MKKILLSLSALVFAISANAQVSDVYISRGVPAANQSNEIKANTAKGKLVNNVSKKTRGFGNNSINIGSTYYDLQTNASMSRRIVNHGNGSVSAIWTSSQSNDVQTGNFADRGTGYAYTTNGTTWSTAIKVENGTVRTGFCNLEEIAGKEWVFNHNSTNRASFGWQNVNLGSSVFTKKVTLDDANITDTILWPKSAVAGSNIYVIGTNSNANDTASTGLYYSYSPDGGVNWPKKCILFPGLTQNQIWNTTADAYNIDAKDSIVSIVVGQIPHNLFCVHSSNYGNTWTVDTVSNDSLAFGVDPLYNRSLTASGDSIMVGSDGSSSVLIDKNGLSHVTYSPVFWMVDSATAATNKTKGTNSRSYSFFPNINSGNSLFHWIEGVKQNRGFVMDSIQDCSNDGKFTIGANQNKPSTTTTPSKSGRYSSIGITNFSQMANRNDTIFVVYSALMDGGTGDTTVAGGISPLSGQNFRDIYVGVSFNNGQKWEQRVNISNSPGLEDVYPSIAKNIDGYLHIIWQSDDEPGTVLTDGDDQSSGNNIQYLKLPLQYIYDHSSNADYVCQNPTFTPLSLYSVDKNGNPVYTLSPNPATNQLTINGNIADNKITVVNAMGQTINVTVSKINETTAILNVSSLANGVYFVNIANANSNVTSKFVKQ